MKHAKKLVLFSLFAMNLVDQPTPDVEVEQGTLRGILNTEGTIFQYLGVPYATVNSTNRFKAPYPPPKWKSVFKAYEEHACHQFVGRLGVLGTEDCLRANIYIPVKPKTSGPLPVMVFIHGGAFVYGSGGRLFYGPDFLVQHDIILVTINYRLGLPGFLCLGIEEAPGNAGLKDQIAGLRWIKRNIAAFGGDPDNITIFGESAGGSSISMLLASEATDGLFKKAIVQSGSSFSSWAMNRNPVWAASLVAAAMGYNTTDPHELYNFFLTKTDKELIKMKGERPLDKFLDTQLLNLPCVEKPISGVEPALSKLPYELISQSKKDVTVMFGSNSKEGLLIMPDETEESFAKKNYMYLFASDLEFASDEEATKVDKKLKELYFGNDRIDIKTKKDEVVKLYTELYFEVPETIESELYLNKTNITVFNYLFDYSGGRNFVKERLGYGNVTGACHGDELFYQFQGIIQTILWPFRIREEDQHIIDWMSKMWTDFAKFGNPTPLSSDVPVRWEPSERGNLTFLHITNELKMAPMPNPEAYQMWKDVYIKHRRKDYYSVYNQTLFVIGDQKSK